MDVPRDNRGNPLERSGPTIGYGVDLGQMDTRALSGLGLEPSLTAKLSPYLRLQGRRAIEYIKRNPLILSKEEVDALDVAVENDSYTKLISKYNKDSMAGRFERLPPGTQTAIADVYYQLGLGGAPEFWRQVTSGDWLGAQNNLDNFGDRYKSRRKLDAGLMDRDRRAGVLPDSGQR